MSISSYRHSCSTDHKLNGLQLIGKQMRLKLNKNIISHLFQTVKYILLNMIEAVKTQINEIISMFIAPRCFGVYC